MWRGLMLNKAVEQFLRDVHWGELDYLFIDMPPGTGDVQMGLARMLPRTDLLIVTTPAIAAQKVAARAADMARRSFLRVCGVIENMSSFTCEHGVDVRAVRHRRRPGAGRRDRGRAARSGAARSCGCRRRRRRRAGGDRRRRSGGRRVPGDRSQDRRRGRSAGQHGRVLGADVDAGRGGARRCRSVQVARSVSRRRRAATIAARCAPSRLCAASAGSLRLAESARGRHRRRRRRDALRRTRGSSSSAASSSSRRSLVLTKRIVRSHPRAGDRLVVVVSRRLLERSDGHEEAGVEAPRRFADRRDPVADPDQIVDGRAQVVLARTTREGRRRRRGPPARWASAGWPSATIAPLASVASSTPASS